MPLLRIITNVSLDQRVPSRVMRRLSQSIATALGKPEDYVMVTLEAVEHMLFAGTETPSAYVELKSLGLPENQTTDLSQLLCDELQQLLRIQPNRIYIEFTNGERHMWGWDGKTFG